MKLKEINQKQAELIIEKTGLNNRLKSIENELEILRKRKKEHGCING